MAPYHRLPNRLKRLWQYTIVNKTEIDSCNCLPACTSIQYEAELSQNSFEWEKFAMATKLNFSVGEGCQFSVLSVFFKEPQFMTIQRSELFGLTDFLANCGGFLGLCMGVSILSLVELTYYFTIRLYSIYREGKAFLCEFTPLLNNN